MYRETRPNGWEMDAFSKFWRKYTSHESVKRAKDSYNKRTRRQSKQSIKQSEARRRTSE